ncbi:NAD(P)H-hydrate dehydratase [Candidatus Woesebacteria bacterium]|nr:NAD(P)H-hydrate dehydratase [Candidatus Woesebacteria bacterium]
MIRTTQPDAIQPFLKHVYIPPKDAHKGQNGKVLIIGGSSLFHAASLWAAEIASHFVDMVHYASTQENNEIMAHLKTTFRNGIVIHRKDIPHYIEEDDAILIGPGMMRSESKKQHLASRHQSFAEILNLSDEGALTRGLTHHILSVYPHKQFVIDAGALQMMEPSWLTKLSRPAIITPHLKEFEELFEMSLDGLSIEEKAKHTEERAREYKCVIVLKSIDDVVTDGTTTHIVRGGNQGLAKGGTGDVLAGLIVSLAAKNDPIPSAVLASFVEKRAAESLFEKKGYWYNVSELIATIPEVFHRITCHLKRKT